MSDDKHKYIMEHTSMMESTASAIIDKFLIFLEGTKTDKGLILMTRDEVLVALCAVFAIHATEQEKAEVFSKLDSKV